MRCPQCGKENDSDAIFCQNCGYSLKKEEQSGFSRTTLVLLVFVILLVAAVGITAGFLLKNTGNTQNQTSPVQISQSTGFPVSEAPNLAVEIAKSNGAVSSITYGNITIDQNQCIYILSRAIVMINQGQQSNIPIKSIGGAPNPYGYISTATIDKTHYLDMANRMSTWMDNNGQTPNFIGIYSPGEPDLSPQNALNLFSKVLVQYKNTGELPASVTI
jgi:predicted nucleic acid-binding Zn ribbon protein